MLNDKTILITGGTGSFGRAFIKYALAEYSPKKLIVFSRDEWKQHEMRTSGFDDRRIRYFIGNVRDQERLYTALNGVDIIIHAAALKQVPACEYNPFEAVKTNVLGAQNIITTSIRRGVAKVIALSSDKAVNPINLYGATKLCSEKMFIAANKYSAGKTLYSVVRYGNVIGSRGSVIPLFQRQVKETGIVTVTDLDMTRFWLTVRYAVGFVTWMLEEMEGGEVFIPKIGSMSMRGLVGAVAPDCQIKIIGIRPGEKMHEVLISEDESIKVTEYTFWYTIEDSPETFHARFSYTSDNNLAVMAIEEMRSYL